MNNTATEEQVLQREVARLESEGYDVFVQPRAPLVPEFLGDYVPDAVATGHGKKIVLEVARSLGSEKLKDVAALFAKQREWELKILLVTPTSSAKTIPVQSRQTIDGAIEEIEHLEQLNALRSAFLLAWATFEAEGRASIAETFDRPQTPGRLVQILSQEGLLTPSEADRMRTLSELRNRLVHGDLSTEIKSEDLLWLVSILREMAATDNLATRPAIQ
ncbi:MAG: HepT-like ribonuclease domain-containing protein [Bradyrhizobium sp.]